MNTNQIAGFTVKPNVYDVRIECDACHESKCGSLAYAWAGSHTCPDFYDTLHDLIPQDVDYEDPKVAW